MGHVLPAGSTLIAPPAGRDNDAEIFQTRVWRSDEESDENMSEVKAPKKGDAGSKKPETKKAEKTEVKKPEAEQPAKAAEPSPAETSAGKADAAPKSASQSSISHFSSVSTPAYRSGWDAIFGGGKATKKTNSKISDGDDFPDQFVISDEDIDTELRTVLYKAFQRQARRQGFSLAKIKKLSDIEYNLECNIRDK